MGASFSYWDLFTFFVFDSINIFPHPTPMSFVHPLTKSRLTFPSNISSSLPPPTTICPLRKPSEVRLDDLVVLGRVRLLSPLVGSRVRGYSLPFINKTKDLFNLTSNPLVDFCVLRSTASSPTMFRTDDDLTLRGSGGGAGTRTFRRQCPCREGGVPSLTF